MVRPKKARSSERFVGIPHWVMNDPAFRSLSHRARALLFDVMLQYNGRNNGSLVICEKAMRPLGWMSKDGLTKAKRELVDGYLLVVTRVGARPNRAAWYAMSWRALDVVEGLDIDPKKYVTLKMKNAFGPPQDGVAAALIGPCAGVKGRPATP